MIQKEDEEMRVQLGRLRVYQFMVVCVLSLIAVTLLLNSSHGPMAVKYSNKAMDQMQSLKLDTFLDLEKIRSYGVRAIGSLAQQTKATLN